MFFTDTQLERMETDTRMKRHKNRCNVTGIIYGDSC